MDDVLLPLGPQTAEGLRSYDGSFGAAGLPTNASSVARSNSLVVKSGPGTLYGFTVYSNKASAQFILLFDTNAVPADGALPVVPFAVAATADVGVYFGPMGRFFFQGIVLTNSSTDNSKTIASADCWFDAQYL